MVWHRVCRNKTVQDKLKKFQRLALKMCGPIRYSTPTRGLEVINYCRPIELELGKIAAEAYLRTMGKEKIPAPAMHTTKITQKGHRQWCHDFLTALKFPFLEQEFDNCPRRWTWGMKYNIDLWNTDKDNDNYGKPKSDTPFYIYTDGSLIKDPSNPLAAEAGGGVYINGGDFVQSNKLGQNVSVPQSEMHSLKRTAIWLIKNQKEIAGQNVAIYTDSLVCLLELLRPSSTSKLELRVKELMNVAARHCDNLYLRWVKSHSGIVANDNADFHAVQAAKRDGPCVQDKPLPTLQTAKMHIRYAIDDLWGFMFRALEHPERCRQTKLWFPDIDKSRSLKIINTKRNQWGALVQLMTGHNHLARHNNIICPIEASPFCSLCDHGYTQDTEHIVAECPRLMGIRQDIFSQRLLTPPFDGLPIGKVLAFLRQSNLRALAWDSK